MDFELAAPEAQIAVVAWHREYLPAETLVDLAAPAGLPIQAELRLGPSRVLTGRLTTRSGLPACEVPVGAVGCGYGQDVLGPSPVFRPCLDSGFGSAETDAQGRFRIPGVADEPAALHLLDDDWEFCGDSHAGEYLIFSDRPVLKPGEDRSYMVWRHSRLVFRAVERGSATPVSAYPAEFRILETGVRLDIREGPESTRQYGLARREFPLDAYRGSGVYAFRVHTVDLVDFARVRIEFRGYQPVEVKAEVLPLSRPIERSVILEFQFTPVEERRTGTVEFVMPADFNDDAHPAIPCSTRLAVPANSGWRGQYAERAGKSRYRVRLTAGEYAELSIGTRPRLRSGPFAIRAYESAGVLELTPDRTRYVCVLVETRDRAGRPLLDCGVSIKQDAGERLLRGWGGVPFAASDHRWPVEVVLDRVRFGDVVPSAVESMIIAVKPGFRRTWVRTTLNPQVDRQLVVVHLERLPPDARKE